MTYVVVATGGKQYKVEQGEELTIERVGAAEGDEIELRPVLFVDGGRVLARPSELGDVKVSARVLGEARGPKIRGFTYKPKTNQRRRYGHRQHLSRVEITAISAPGTSKRDARDADDEKGSD